MTNTAWQPRDEFERRVNAPAGYVLFYGMLAMMVVFLASIGWHWPVVVQVVAGVVFAAWLIVWFVFMLAAAFADQEISST